MFVQNQETLEFLEAYNRLWRNGAFSIQDEVADMLKYHRTSLNQVLKGKRNMPPEKLNLFYLKYKLSQQKVAEVGKTLKGENQTSENMQSTPQNVIDEIIENNRWLREELRRSNEIIRDHIGNNYAPTKRKQA